MVQHDEHSPGPHAVCELNDRPDGSPALAPLRRPSRCPSSIGPLPTELLMEIFRLVFNRLRQPNQLDFFFPRRRRKKSKPPPTPWLNVNFPSDTLFPYALASVCTGWCAMLATKPEYWTQIAISVDDQPTPLVKIQSYLEWSRELPLDILVARRRNRYPERDPGEHARVAAVMEIISPHLHRCTRLRFDLLHNSSLLTKTFRGAYPHLKSLRLTSRTGACDSGDIVDNEVDWEPGWNFSCPNLTNLEISGTIFGDAVRCSWLQELPNLESLSLSQFGTAENRGMRPSAREILAAIPRSISALTLEHVELHDTVVDRHSDHLSNVTTLALEDIDIGTLASFFLAINDHYFESVSITRSLIPPRTHINCYALILTNIPPDQDLRWLLKGWRGSSLHFRSCPFFNDELIAGMGGASRRSPILASQVRELEIQDCKNFTADALVRMIQNRRDLAYETNPWEYDEPIEEMDFYYVRPLEGLCLLGVLPPMCRERARANALVDTLDSPSF
ncbi:hypothetical protein BV22DRAFT_1032606 [Leucogyrophana mollusca]|uniref:Uncharacterized protein n=1 Tax=Leucogyrophana mollusca TaxID=85980 RepID=A0ACB8BMA1_9AGAM|nr:hypothetical protein BV22DRAFT_1032606 [Leucogyrophana mollusca]